jgi:hypothetical protein
MKTTDLKVGDYVSYKDKTYKVWSLNGTIACIEQKQGRVMGALVESLSPIPLTFDILTKCGWLHHHDEICNIPFDFGTLNVVYDKKFDDYLISVSAKNMIDTVVLRSVSYIHELQHVLWALGLEDNMKI